MDFSCPALAFGGKTWISTLSPRPKKSPCFVAIFYNIEKRVILRALLPESWLKVTLFGFYTRNLPKSPFFKNYLISLAPEIALFWKKGDFFSVGTHTLTFDYPTRGKNLLVRQAAFAGEGRGNFSFQWSVHQQLLLIFQWIFPLT